MQPAGSAAAGQPSPRRARLFSWGKYLEVSRITLRSQFAYLGDTVMGLLFLAMFMFVFANLWRSTYAGSTEVEGYTLVQVVWYLVFTEVLVMSAPRLQLKVDGEVKGGDLAYMLNKPYQYIGFHYAGFMAEAVVRAAIALVIGGGMAWLMVGPLPLSPGGILPVLTAYLLAQSVQFCLSMAVGLLAFWVEDTSGVMLLVDKTKWILGGMLIPMELMPEGLARFARWLPFQDLLYGPARLFANHQPGEFLTLAARLGLWLVLALLLVRWIYRLGTRRLEINGG